MNYIVDPNATDRQIVGMLDIEKINSILGASFTNSGEVWMYPGLKKHVMKKHVGIFENYHQCLPAIIASPDYIGRNPSEPNSVELVKRISDTILLAIKLDPTGYLYVSSFYDLKNAEIKIHKRLNSGRLKPYNV
ncbi:plasmid-related protein [Brevibacillus laterosporus]|uniref:PBECR3 domain-containing polyvalent protein n=1 Tax=Brevibacillus laterosporus TaxID=1465 RepID=UPI0014444D11|nr:plasmid-related protein [Brevibacillus laterosporus]NKQ22772.1 plasmid-related protein [Brevibacillus laterosporus]WNX33766.1 plasmid-related protein [Brevibacillus laterosporus]